MTTKRVTREAIVFTRIVFCSSVVFDMIGWILAFHQFGWLLDAVIGSDGISPQCLRVMVYVRSAWE